MIKGELFSQPFIPKLLDGTKIRTSGPIKPQPKYVQQLMDGRFETSNDGGFDSDVRYIKSKYRPGDIMYVRETWQRYTPHYANGMPLPERFIYRSGCHPADELITRVVWLPSIHMPREAARIFLRVTDVKVQHIDTMTEQDAVEEGFEADEDIVGWTAKKKFNDFWEKQYGPDCPWMWVYYFQPISREEAHYDR